MGEVKPPLVMSVARTRRQLTIVMCGNVLKIGTDLFDEEIREHMDEQSVAEFGTEGEERRIFIDFGHVHYVMVEPDKGPPWPPSAGAVRIERIQSPFGWHDHFGGLSENAV